MNDYQSWDAVLSISDGERSKKHSSIFLERIAKVISYGLDREDFFQYLLDSMIELLKAERGALFLTHEDKLCFVSGRNVNNATIEDAKAISQSAVNKSVSAQQVIHSFDALNDSRFKEAMSVTLNEIHSLLCAPLTINHEVIGAIYLDSRITTHLFSEYEIELFKTACKLIAAVVDKSLACRKLQEELLSRQSGLIIKLDEAYLVTKVVAMQEVLKRVDCAAKSNSNVLLLGETGVGKGVLARLIHNKSQRSAMPFINYHCATTPETLFESQLFGHKRGAFTDARYDKKGLIEAADKGTLFLDEIATIPLSIQAKLLGIIEEKMFRRLGENTPRKANVRLICASNKDLETLIKISQFREDLYYRMNTITIKIPPLRERKEEIPLLARCFLKKFSTELNKNVITYDPKVIDTLIAYHWPGNVRELRNVVEHAVIYASGSQISLETLPQGIIARKSDNHPLREQKGQCEKKQIIEVLTYTQGNVTKAAHRLSVTPRHLRRLLKKYQLNRQDFALDVITSPDCSERGNL
jgi:Nif-specific regulatory protein